MTPDAPGDPYYISSSETSIEFGWTSPEDAGRSNGGSALTAYIIQWDSGDSGSDFVDLTTISDPNVLTFSMANPPAAITTG